MRKKIHFYLNDTKNRIAVSIDVFINLLVFGSVLDFSLGTIPGMNEKLPLLGTFYELGIFTFSFEYLLRFYSSPKRIKYVFSFWSFVDLIALAPYYLGIPADLRSVRVVRFFKLLRYNNSVVNISNGFRKVKNELIVFSGFTIFLLYVSAVGIYHFENPIQPENFTSIFDSMWWSVATLTTVGYGDMFPITAGGKIFASIIVFVGLGIIAIPTALIASSFQEAFKNNK